MLPLLTIRASEEIKNIVRCFCEWKDYPPGICMYSEYTKEQWQDVFQSKEISSDHDIMPILTSRARDQGIKINRL